MTATNATYDLSGIVGSPDLGSLATGMNGILNGYYYGLYILFAVGLVVFFYLKSKGYYTTSCWVATSWITMVLSLFLRPMGLIGNYTFWVCILLPCLIIFWVWMED